MKFTFALVSVILTVVVASDPNDFLADSDEALQFLHHVPRSFFHPGKTKCEEQKREARKSYEEKCTLLGKRFCPKLSTWKEFQQYEIGDGYEKNRRTSTTETPPANKQQTMRTHPTSHYTPATMRTYSTSLYGPPTPRPVYRTPVYRPPVKNENRVTQNPFD